MQDYGFWSDSGTQYVFYLNDDTIMLFPSMKENMYVGIHHNEKDRYEIRLEGNPGIRGAVFEYLALIISTRSLNNGSYELKAKSILKTWKGMVTNGFDLFGDAVDDFVRLDYDFQMHISKSGSLLREQTTLDQWDLSYHGIPVTVQLLYMNTVSNDGRDRREYHPVFRVLLQGNRDIRMLLPIYEAMLNFIRLWRYRYPCGEIQVKLLSKSEGGDVTRIGMLSDYSHQHEYFKRRYVILPYEILQPHMNGLLNVAFGADNLQLDYLPVSSYRSFRNEYDLIMISKLYTAFEKECNNKPNLYNRADSSKIDTVKQRVLDYVDKVDLSEATKEEREFVRNVKSDIRSKGNVYGQKRKLAAILDYLYPVLREFIIRTDLCYDGNEEIIKEKALGLLKKIPSLRGKVVHSGNMEPISEEEAKALSLLELIVYTQILKRHEFSDSALREIISIVFEHYPGNFTYIVPD